MALKILENVRYRIQNVDFGTFLEQRGDTSLVMRPQKDSSKQQWTFVNHSDRDAHLPTYVIRNAYNDELFVNAERATPPTDSHSVSLCESPLPNTAKWKLSATNDGNVF
jgi:hypothetical protein